MFVIMQNMFDDGTFMILKEVATVVEIHVKLPCTLLHVNVIFQLCNVLTAHSFRVVTCQNLKAPRRGVYLSLGTRQYLFQFCPFQRKFSVR